MVPPKIQGNVIDGSRSNDAIPVDVTYSKMPYLVHIRFGTCSSKRTLDTR